VKRRAESAGDETIIRADEPSGSERFGSTSEDRETLHIFAMRLAWMSLAGYAAVSLGLWAAHGIWPMAIGPVSDYTVEVAAIAGVTFGGLYAAAMTLRPDRAGDRPTLADR